MEEEKNIVDKLIDLAFSSGVEKALKEAKSLNNPYILDEFHDRLVEELKKKRESKNHA